MNEPLHGTPHRLITTRLEFHQALREGFADAARLGGREMWLSDESFVDWPLGDVGVIEQLTQWAQPHRKLIMVARQFDDVVRQHPRFVAWRRQWSHIVDCRAFEDAEAGDIPTLLLLTDLVTVRLFDPVHYRGSLSRERADFVRYRELIDAVSQRSVSSFPSTLLGL